MHVPLLSKLSNIRSPPFHIISMEMDTYLLTFIQALYGIPILIEDIARKVVLVIRDKVVKQVLTDGTTDTLSSSQIKLTSSMNHTKACSHWFKNFIHRNNFKIMTRRGKLGFLHINSISSHHIKIKKLLLTPLSKISALRMM